MFIVEVKKDDVLKFTHRVSDNNLKNHEKMYLEAGYTTEAFTPEEYYERNKDRPKTETQLF